MTVPPHDPSYARLDRRVTGLETAVNGIAENIRLLGEKLDTRSRPQWLLIVGALGLVVTILGLILAGWKAPLDTTIQRQEYDIRQLQDGNVPRVELDGQWNALQREADETRRRLDRIEDRAFSPTK